MLEKLEALLNESAELTSLTAHNAQAASELRVQANNSTIQAQKHEAELKELDSALKVLISLSGEVADRTYKAIENSANAVLAEMFPAERVQIHLAEDLTGKYPHLNIEVISNGVSTTLAFTEGHGVSQVVSLICVLCTIIASGSRRFMVLDEALSGVSDENMSAVGRLLNSFTEIGFQFAICDHGFVPSGAQVYELEKQGGKTVVAAGYLT